MRFLQEIVRVRADEIVSEWIDFFVLHKSIAPERITIQPSDMSLAWSARMGLKISANPD